MKFVGFVGPKGAGKDESAKVLKELKASKGKISFAGPLKVICSKVFGIPIQMFNDPAFKEQTIHDKFGGPITLNRKHFRELKNECMAYVSEIDATTGAYRYRTAAAAISGLEGQVMNTYRELLQFIGTEFIRDRMYVNWHVEAAFGEKVLSELSEGVYCITDARFPNELEFLKNRFGEDFECYYVERTEAEERLAVATHPSELQVKLLREVIGEEHVLSNSGSVEDLKGTLKPLAERLKSAAPPASGKKKTGRFVYGSAK